MGGGGGGGAGENGPKACFNQQQSQSQSHKRAYHLVILKSQS